MVGGTLLSMAEAYDEEPEAEGDLTWVWVTGAVLMAMGAIYAGQLLHSASKFCLRRLRLAEGGEGLRLDAMVSEAESLMMKMESHRLQRGTGRAFQHPGRACDSPAQAVQFALHP